MGILGGATAYLPAVALTYVSDNYPSLFTYAIIFITLIYILLCHLTAFKESHSANADLIKDLLNNDDVKSTLLEPLYYTFKTKSHRYKSTKFGLLDEMNDTVKSMSGESVIHYVLWCLMALVFILEFSIFSSHLMNANLPFTDNGEQEVQVINEGNAQ